MNLPSTQEIINYQENMYKNLMKDKSDLNILTIVDIKIPVVYEENENIEDQDIFVAINHLYLQDILASEGFTSEFYARFADNQFDMVYIGPWARVKVTGREWFKTLWEIDKAVMLVDTRLQKYILVYKNLGPKENPVIFVDKRELILPDSAES